MQHVCKKTIWWNQRMYLLLKKTSACTHTKSSHCALRKLRRNALRTRFLPLFSLVSLWMIFSSGDEKTPSCVCVRLLGLEEPDLLFSLLISTNLPQRKICWGVSGKILQNQERTYVLFLSVWCYTVLLGFTWAVRGGVRNAVGGAGGQNGNFVGVCWELKGLHRIWSSASWV